MNIDNIQIIANDACFSIDPNVKLQSQKLFIDFTYNLDIRHYSQILQNFSNTVLFVFLSYLNKKIPQSSQIQDIFQIIKAHTLKWSKPNGSLKRTIDKQNLPNWIVNTIGFCLGICMKYIFINQKSRKRLIDIIKNQQNSKFRLFLYKNFIDVVSTIDNQISYVLYRTLIYSFQQQIIPLVIKDLYPYFIQISQNIKIDQLSNMLPCLNDSGQSQEQLLLINVNVNKKDYNNNNNLKKQLKSRIFRHEQKFLTDIVFFLLNQIITFKYNISLSQYDLQTQYQNCLINFPQSIINNLITKQFIQSLYYMIQKIINIQLNSHYGQIKQLTKYLQVSFDILKKILLTKTINFNYQKKNVFILLNYNGIMRFYGCLNSIMNIYNSNIQFNNNNINNNQINNINNPNIIIQQHKKHIIKQIFDCTSKYIHSIQLSQIQKIGLNHLQIIKQIKQKTLFIMKFTSITIDNKLFTSITQLIYKVTLEAISMSQSKYINVYEDLSKSIWEMFFYNVFYRNDQQSNRNNQYNSNHNSNNVSILGNLHILKVSQLQITLHQFFSNIIHIGSMNIGYMLNMIGQRVQQIFKSKNIIKISNLIFLLTQICRQNFYQRSIIYQTSQYQDIKILGYIIQKCFEYVDYYKNININIKEGQCLILDISIILFYQIILSQCLNNITIIKDQYINQQISISLNNNITKSKPYFIITSRTFQIINSYKLIPSTHQQFLLFIFKEILFNISITTNKYKNKNQCIIIISKCLDCLYSLLLKLKWSTKRQLFNSTIIYKDILQLTIQISNNSLMGSLQQLKQRKKLFRIITILSFDDVFDSYRLNLQYIIEKIQMQYLNATSLSNDLANKKLILAKIVFDLAGIVQNIDTAVIYRQFLNRLNDKIGLSNLIEVIYLTFSQDLQILQQVLYLNRSLLSDKALRMSNKQLSILIYQIIDISLPFLTGILVQSNKQNWVDILKQTYMIANLIFDSTYINLQLLLRKSKDKFLIFVYRMLQNSIINYQWIITYPQFKIEYQQFIHSILLNGTQFVLSLSLNKGNILNIETIDEILDLFNKFILLVMNSITLIFNDLLQSLNSGSGTIFKKQNSPLQKLLESLCKFYSIIRFKQYFQFRLKLQQNIQKLLNIQGINYKKIQFLQTLYKVGMSNLKNFNTILDRISNLIYQMSYFYKDYYQQIFINLGINQNKIKYFLKIYNLLINQNNSISIFKSDLKQWLNSMIKDCEIQNDQIDY